jgi:2-C-methyl-D-erythritol 2,4-cyclodiphosphate synthase
MRVGLGYDVHPFGESGDLVLGGVVLEGPQLVGHSDGDAVAHAVADAVLSAVGASDLGTLFPASDERYRDANSLELLAEVAERVKTARWWIGNVDVVIAAERPRLGPHVPAMCDNLTAALKTAAEPLGGGVSVSVKAKRGEGLGAIGRAEGIAVWAVALLGS